VAPAQSDALVGSCLCHGITVTLPDVLTDVGVCHCPSCLRWNSGPWMSLQAPGAVIEGDCLVIYRSSTFAERGFCRTCGSHVFHRPQDGPELAVFAGLFQDPRFFIAREIFYDTKPPFYHFVADSVRRSSGSMAAEWLPKLLVRRLMKRLRPSN
jgi:hypothetical protein